MKKIATFIVGLFSCCATISANPTETDGFIYSEDLVFYCYLSIGADLSYKPLSSGTEKLCIFGGSFTIYGYEYTLNETLPNGDKVFRSNTATAVVYILSADKKKLARHLIWGNQWCGSIFYTSSKAEWDKFYLENRNKTLPGISFNLASSSYDLNSRGSNTSGNVGSSTCTACGGTGVNPHPEEGTSYSGSPSWAAHYNTRGTACSICGSYSSHFHSRCSSCNIPR